jgi:predicted lysophospholipase L1 biosynthesis ABC-type transport system permease subunit
VTATPGYTESLGMGVRGGTLSWNDPTGVLVTARLAERLWPGEDPVGRPFTSGDGSSTWRVAGVIDVLRPVVIEPPAEAVVVPVDGVPYAAALRAIVVTVRTDGLDPLALIPAVRRVVARLEPAVAIANARTMDAVAREATLPYSIIFGVIGFWAAACLLLSAVGTWGVVSHVAGRRTKEIAIRLALGARPGDVRRAVAGRTFRLTGIGAVTGIAAAAVVTRVLEAMLHGVDPLDPGVFVTVAAIVCGSAFVAGWIPTRRAMRVNLRDALHAD